MSAVQLLEGRGRRILVIDDDLDIRELMRSLLERMDFVVDLADDDLAGLRRLETGDGYDVILLEPVLSRCDGYELIDSITRRFPHDRPHIVVLTAGGQPGIDKLPERSVCNALTKPFDLAHLLEIVGACLDRTHEPG